MMSTLSYFVTYPPFTGHRCHPACHPTTLSFEFPHHHNPLAAAHAWHTFTSALPHSRLDLYLYLVSRLRYTLSTSSASDSASCSSYPRSRTLVVILARRR
ncbi:hypothetical protein FA13DRAFT_1729903 [Coprinellus micaceus]|uniref:Uncharacterized protein n=1 Tax=Coprinellus micaceus TaxID=71717 RepID=A0A4Y7TLK4_COPMI|nr:hypothetical protein FA13DRAFT_1729903 [Coprinellus micaceus]